MSITLRGVKGSGHEPLAEINVTPLVDVMLVLLIIFMVTAPLLTAGMKINLPKAGGAQALNPKEPLVITIDKNGGLSMGDAVMDLDAIGEAVRAKLGGDTTRVVQIRGDKDAAFGEIVTVMDRLTTLGVSHIAIRTDGKAAAKAVAPSR